MANIFTSSIGKKVIMSVTGLFLILFLLLHGTINALYIFNPEWFVSGCEFMALPIVTIMVPVLAAGFIIHIIYAFYLSYTNLKARGNQRYEVANKSASDGWAAKNMLVLGIIVLGFLAFHLTHFWAEMQLKEFMGVAHEDLISPVTLMETTFKPWWVTLLYILWFVAVWFHLTHGFWSALHTFGWNNNKWIGRLKCIYYIVATIIFVIFAAVAIVAFSRANGFCSCCCTGCC